MELFSNGCFDLRKENPEEGLEFSVIDGTPLGRMTLDEYIDQVANGRNLNILDDEFLDEYMQDYFNHHDDLRSKDESSFGQPGDLHR